MIQLDLHTLLPLVRQAFDAGDLQIQTRNLPHPDGPGCQYSGPCAVGVGLTPDQREYFDISHEVIGRGVGQLIRQKLIEVPEDQVEDFWALQRAHDSMDLEVFEERLKNLEAKYGLRPDRG